MASPSLSTKYDEGSRNISNVKYDDKFRKRSTRLASSSADDSKVNELNISSNKKNDDIPADLNIRARHGGFAKLLRAIYDFSRPYTIKMAIINTVGIAILPLSSLAQVNPAFLVGLLQVLTANILARVYTSGINEIYDVELDKINKPYLPIASGALSMKLAVAIVSMCLLGSVAPGIMLHSPPLIIGALMSFLLGSLYSVELPLMRWKRYPVLVCILAVMHSAISLPFSTFFHIQKYVLGSSTMFFTKSLIFTSCFMTSTVIVLGLFKDIPDILGDKKHGLQTLAVKLGVKRVFWICISILMMTYGGAIGVGVTSSSLVTKFVTVPGHLSIACTLLYRAVSVDLSVDGAAQRFYMFLWSLMLAEFLLIPFVH